MIGKKVYRTHSTNDSMAWARAHIGEAPDGSVFLADVLTHARGRQGRVWKISPGQLCVTFLLKPEQLVRCTLDDYTIRLNQLNMALSLGILETLKQHNVHLKWPNDFFLQDKKLGGMLIQTAWDGTRLLSVIIGFALNINNEFLPDDDLFHTAISLKRATGSEHELRPLYKNIMAGLNLWYHYWQQEEFLMIYKAWRNEQINLGRNISIHQKDGLLIKGIAQQVLPNGDLLLVTENKKQVIISFYQVEEIVIT